MPTAQQQARIGEVFIAATGGHPMRPFQDDYAFRVADVADLPPPSGDAWTVRLQADAGLGKGLGYLIPLALRAVSNAECFIVATYRVDLLKQLIEIEMPKVRAAVRRITGKDIAYGKQLGRNQFVDANRIKEVIARLRTKHGAIYSAAVAMMGQWHAFATDPGSSGLISEALEDATLDLMLPVDVSADDICLTALSDPAAPWSEKYQSQIEDIGGGARILFVTHASMMIDAYRSGRFLLQPEGVRGIVFDEAERAIDTAEAMNTYRQSIADLFTVLTRYPHVAPGLLAEITLQAQQFLGLAAPSPADEPAFVASDEPTRRIEARIEAVPIDLKNPQHRAFVANTRRLVEAIEALPPSQYHDLDEIAGLRRWLYAVDAMPIAGEKPLFRALLEPVRIGLTTSYGPAFVATSRMPARIFTRLWRKTGEDAPLVDFVLFTSATITASMSAELGAKAHALDADLAVRRFGRLHFYLAGNGPPPFIKTPNSFPTLNPAWIKATMELIDQARLSPSPNNRKANRTLVLCPSYEDCARLARGLTPAAGPVLVHEPGVPLRVLLEEFQYERYVTLLTPAAWEGVDLPDTIDQLVIPRVPFPPPNLAQDALRLETWATRNGPTRSFLGYINIDRAVARMKQAVGRAIRTPHWSANLWIGDARMPIHAKVRLDPRRRNVISPLAVPLLSRALPKRFTQGLHSAYESATILSEIH